MARIRITTERVRAGGAARAAEQDARDGGGVRRVERIRAGSGAQLAEEARRAAGGDGRPMTAPGFSLRAEGGQVRRVETPARSVPAAPAGATTAGIAATEGLTLEPRGWGAAVSATAPPEISPPQATPPPPPSGAGRLKTFFRGLFLPKEPPSPSKP